MFVPAVGEQVLRAEIGLLRYSRFAAGHLDCLGARCDRTSVQHCLVGGFFLDPQYRSDARGHLS